MRSWTKGKSMQRPVMDPSFVFEKPAAKAPKVKWPRLAWVKRVFSVAVRLLMAAPFRKQKLFRNEEGTRLSRFVRGLTYRLAFAPDTQRGR